MPYQSIARLFERKQALAAVHMAAVSEPLRDGFLAYDSPGSYVNRAGGWQSTLTDAELDKLVAFYHSRNEDAVVELSPFVDESLLLGLENRGFALRSFENVLSHNLASLPALPLLAEGLSIERVDPSDVAAMRRYVAVAASGFMPPGEAVPETLMQIGLRFAMLPTADCYVAVAHGDWVGAAGSESSEGITSMFGTTVFEKYRRQGLQQALMIARMQAGIKRGSTLAIICSRPGIPTERNAARLGFTMAYTRAVLVRPFGSVTPK